MPDSAVDYRLTKQERKVLEALEAIAIVVDTNTFGFSAHNIGTRLKKRGFLEDCKTSWGADAWGITAEGLEALRPRN